MAAISFRAVGRTFPGAVTPSVSGFDLEIADGEFMVLVGPSGCGKSTTLRMLAGLEPVDEGEIHLGGQDISADPPRSRDIAMVFQTYALYPHMSVAENLGFALKMAKVPRADRDARVGVVAKMLGLDEYLQRKPKALSGGQRQRVAMGRAIVRAPQVFCMDEPLSNLDAKMRVQTRTDIRALQRELGVTTVYVTHDQVEAMTMGDRVAVMNAGELQQVDTPLRLYDRPANLFVATFIGSPRMSLLPASQSDGQVLVGGLSIGLSVPAGVRSPNLLVGVRPEDWRFEEGHAVGLGAEVSLVEELGSDSFAYCRAAVGSESIDVIARLPHRGAAAAGDRITLLPEPSRVHLFDRPTGARL